MNANLQVISRKAIDGSPRVGPGRAGGRKLASLYAALAASAWLAGASDPAFAVPLEAPKPDHMFTACTFDVTLLRQALTITSPGGLNPLVNDQIAASYILVYVRENRNDGQALDPVGTGGFTGPVLCVNGATDSVNVTTETTALPVQPDADSVDILGAEQAFHLRYEVNGGASDGEKEKRVCHSTDGGFNDCALVQPQ